MAGKKDKKSAKDTAKGASLLPKSIAGVKLPKEARRQLTDLAKHPIVADLLAAGLVALAARIKGELEPQAKTKADAPADPPAPPTPLAPPPAPEPPATPSPPKRTRKPAAAKDAAAAPAAKPPVRRTRKPASPKPKAPPAGDS
ncbi:hypothetical protein ACX40Y_06790 [Sphingomonas sp. RS6]